MMLFYNRKFRVMEPGLEGPSKKNLLSTSPGPMSTADYGCLGVISQGRRSGLIGTRAPVSVLNFAPHPTRFTRDVPHPASPGWNGFFFHDKNDV